MLPAPTSLTTSIVLDSQQTFTLYGTLESLGTRLAGQRIVFSTGSGHGAVTLCIAATDADGISSCALDDEASADVAENDGRYTASYEGTASYLPVTAAGQADLLPNR